jgi:malate dehydrogenase
MKITVVGAGAIGATLAYRIADKDLADELVLVDIAKDLAIGQSLDIIQSIAYSGKTEVTAGDYSKSAGSDLVIISAGKPRSPGMARLDLMNTNKGIVGAVVKDVMANSPDTMIMTVTNPMDVMNYVAWKGSGLPRERVIGSGGQLDGSRFKCVLAGEFGVRPKDVEAYVLGEHGELQVPVFSNVKVNGKAVSFNDAQKEAIREKIRRSAMDVIEKKGATVFAPINTTTHMVEAIVNDTKALIPSSMVLDGEYGKRGVSLGVPVILGKDGIEEVLEWKLEPYERKIFDEAAEKLGGYCKTV